MGAPITDTGIKGFLKWFKQEQPNLYLKVAAQMPQSVPAAFSNYNQGGWRTAGLSRDDAVKKLGAIYAGSPYSGRVGVSGLGAAYFNYSSYAGVDPGALQTVSIDTSTAANSGPSSTSVTSGIASIINSVAQVALTANQVNNQNKIVNMQLQRAAAGLPPLPISLGANGVPMVGVSAGISSGSMLVIGAIALGAMLLSGKRSAA